MVLVLLNATGSLNARPLKTWKLKMQWERLKRRTQIELKKNKHVFKHLETYGESFYDALHDFKLTVLTMFYMISR